MDILTTGQQKATNEVISFGIDRLESLIGYDSIDSSDLHNYLYNQDYFKIYTYDAKEWLALYDVFNAMEKIKEYETDNFGEVNTDLSSAVAVANMLAYIIGEEALNNCKTYNTIYATGELTDKQMETIKDELNAQIK